MAAAHECDPQLIGENQQPVRISDNSTERTHLDNRAEYRLALQRGGWQVAPLLPEVAQWTGRSRRDEGASLFSEARCFVTAGDGSLGVVLFLRGRWVNLALPSGG